MEQRLTAYQFVCVLGGRSRVSDILPPPNYTYAISDTNTLRFIMYLYSSLTTTLRIFKLKRHMSFLLFALYDRMKVISFLFCSLGFKILNRKCFLKHKYMYWLPLQHCKKCTICDCVCNAYIERSGYNTDYWYVPMLCYVMQLNLGQTQNLEKLMLNGQNDEKYVE